jgi:hypothetical protein
MKEMNSLTHSCMHSLASLAILAFSGSAIFMIRATGAKLRMLASDAVLLFAAALFGVDCGGEVEDCGEDDISQARHRRSNPSTCRWELRCGEEAREIDVPLAIGSHLSCSLTSTS